MKLETRGITKSFDGTRIIEDISITLGEGELVCLLGVSGGGKTTLFNIIAGLSKPDSGQVLIDGEDVTGKPGHVSYMLQKDLLLPFRKVADNVALPLELAGTDRKTARAEAMRYFEQFGLQGTEDRYPAQLSGGMRQRAACCAPICSARASPCWMSPSLPWTPLPNRRSTGGTWM